MISTCRDKYAEDIEVGDQLDLDGDEYADNEQAIYSYAVVLQRSDFYQNKEPYVKLTTSQGEFAMPAGHVVKVKVDE
jgi:hypothetical protein